MSEAAIEVAGLTVRAGGRTILSLERWAVPPRQIFAVLGPNGAGKSTLLKACLGFVRPSAGGVRVLGQAPAELRAGALARLRRRIGYVPQILAARSEMPLTVREVVAVGRTGLAGLLRPLRRADWQCIDEWIERLGLKSLADQAYGDISGGEQRKTLIARAMVQEPELLLLDEPTANLDLGWREQIVSLVETLYRQTGATVVLVCHELEVLPPACRQLLLLKDGRPLASGEPEAILTASRVASLYGPGLEVLSRRGRLAVVSQGEGAG
jgi:ABC-type cobalamin/Fe3+-siderophores transport system ATPase subunit